MGAKIKKYLKQKNLYEFFIRPDERPLQAKIPEN
jgi:hypothetical protein